MNLNSNRLKEYLSRLVIFPKRQGKARKGDANSEDVSNARQLKGDIIAAKMDKDSLATVKISEVSTALSLAFRILDHLCN